MDKGNVAQALVEIATLLGLKGKGPIEIRDNPGTALTGFPRSSQFVRSTIPPLFVAALIVWLLTPQSAPAVETTKTNAVRTLESFLSKLGYASVPMKRDGDNQPLVEARIDGKRRRLLVDTGWTFTSMDRSIGRKWKSLGYQQVKLGESFFVDLAATNIVLMPDLQLGNALFTNQPTMVEPDSHLPQMGIDGVIGCDFLHRNFCIIDCRKLTLFVRAEGPAASVPNAMATSLERSGYRKVNLEVSSMLGMTCGGKVNGESVRLLVDTGWFWTSLDLAAGRRCHLNWLPTSSLFVGVRGRRAKIFSTGFKSFELDSFPLPTATKYLGVADLEPWHVGDHENSVLKVDGILGDEMLLVSQAIIDFGGRCMWIVPRETNAKN